MKGTSALRRKAPGAALVVPATVLGALWASPAAASSDDRATAAQAEVSAADRESGGVQAAVGKGPPATLSPEERIANGELLLRSKDYARAIDVLSEVVEGYEGTPSYPDALYLRGEAYYGSNEYIAARRDFRVIADHGSEPRFSGYVARALGRIVDIGIRTGDFASLEDAYNRLNQVPGSLADATVQYAKGKAAYFRKDYAAADAALSNVGAQTPYAHQARYFQGLVAMRQAKAAPAPPNAAPPGAPTAPGSSGTLLLVPNGTTTPAAPVLDYKPAVEVFRRATELQPDTDEHRHVIDLSWMAIGRLFYEMEQYEQASEAYSKIGRDSAEFDTMLYELAWVYVRLGDVQRAERSLEVLSIADPNSSYIADGTLLRADLLLRAGAFEKALQLYQGVLAQYDPMRVKVENFLDSTKDVAAYYERLSRQRMDDLDQSEQLPPLTIQWAREAEDGPLAFAVIDDVNTCRRLIKDSESLIVKLTTLTNSANRVRAFPDLLNGEQKALGALNRISKARLEVARGLDDDEPATLSGEIGTARDERRKLMAMVAAMPVSDADFATRDYQGQRQWNTVSQELTRRLLEIDQLQAEVNGLRLVLRQDAQRGVKRSPADVASFQTGLDEQEHLLKSYTAEAAELRKQIEVGRAQVGVGDSRYQNDASVRAQFRDVLEREVQLAGTGQGGSDAQRFSSRVQPILAQARGVEGKLNELLSALERQVDTRVVEFQGKVEVERQKIAGYKDQLGAYDGEARDLVGHVAERNFQMVRDKLRGIVLRADVGITEQAWEVREEEQERVRNLQNERTRQENVLEQELREVLDDAGDKPSAK